MYMRAVRSWVIIGKNLRESDQSNLLSFISQRSKNIYAILRSSSSLWEDADKSSAECLRSQSGLIKRKY